MNAVGTPVGVPGGVMVRVGDGVAMGVEMKNKGG
jgi:hypothetical protein